MIEFGDYIFIELEYKLVVLAEWFKTLPMKYDYLKKTHEIVGRADKQSVLIGANMKPELTIVLIKKDKKNKLSSAVSASDVSSFKHV